MHGCKILENKETVSRQKKQKVQIQETVNKSLIMNYLQISPGTPSKLHPSCKKKEKKMSFTHTFRGAGLLRLSAYYCGMHKGRWQESMDTYICVDRSSAHTLNFMPETTNVQDENEGNWQDITDSKIFINLESFYNVKLSQDGANY